MLKEQATLEEKEGQARKQVGIHRNSSFEIFVAQETNTVIITFEQ